MTSMYSHICWMLILPRVLVNWEATSKDKEHNDVKLSFSWKGKALNGKYNLLARVIQLTFISFILYLRVYGGEMEFDSRGM